MRARYKVRVTTRILLVRHGETTWNAEKRWQGWANSELSELGMRQAVEAAEGVGAVDAIVASDLDRAADTARIISELIGVGPVMTEPGLRERDVGEWSGLTAAEIDARWPGAYAAWRADPNSAPPGGETNETILRRAHDALRRIAEAWDGAEVLAVSHGGLMRLLERDSGIERPPPVPNLGGFVVAVHGDRIDVGDRVLLLDPSTDHVTAPPNL
jgi:glucosyl-3-phosphoglycerate phosphatase